MHGSKAPRLMRRSDHVVKGYRDNSEDALKALNYIELCVESQYLKAGKIGHSGCFADGNRFFIRTGGRSELNIFADKLGHAEEIHPLPEAGRLRPASYPLPRPAGADRYQHLPVGGGHPGRTRYPCAVQFPSDLAGIDIHPE